MSGENFKLDREIDAARLLRANLADIIEGDEDFARDIMEAETNINEAIQAAVNLYAQDRTSVQAIDEHIKLMEARKLRLARRMEMTRALVSVALEQAGRKSVETPLGTASLKQGPKKLIIDEANVADIPLEYWKPGDPKLDKKRLKADIESGKTVKGARVENDGAIVSFTFK